MRAWNRTLAAGAFVSLASVAPAQVFGPTPYLSAADSPFQPASFPGYFHLENMEDGVLNTPGVSANIGNSLGPGTSTDSVDADDGSIDGSGLLGTSYLVAGSGNPTGNFTYSGAVLGRLPTHAGLVVTDAYDPVVVEGFAWDGSSLGTVTITGYGPFPDTQGQTAEDRFVGFVHQDGILQIRVTTGGFGGIEVDHIQYGCVLRPFVPFCFGDGTGTPCPCNNQGAPGNGCAHSGGTSGANLDAGGFASVSDDSVLLYGSGMTSGPALYFQGSNWANSGNGVAFGDGLPCVAGTVVRLGLRQNNMGSSFYPDVGNPRLSQNLLPGQTRFYQVTYRNVAPFCTTATQNFTNGMMILWAP